jgi:(4S)-4-hydroxy-5-phosphonooxypentane-2,3-dione isomerase
MYVIAVEFTIHSQHAPTFMPLMLENARNSLQTEPGCRRFDVCRDPSQPERIFLYELYDDRAAFDLHRATAHFKAFDAATTAMIAKKTVHSYELIDASAA